LYYPALNAVGGDTFNLQNTVYNFPDWKTNTGLDTVSVVADGDFNLDGRLSAADLLLGYRQLLGLTSLDAEQLAHGDLYPPTGDGVVDFPDIVVLHKLIFQ